MRSTSILKINNPNQKGFTLIEFVLALVLIVILTVLSINSLTNNLNESRFDETIRRMKLVRKGLVGDVTLKQGSTRSDFGFLGDVGAIPTAAQGIAALITNPGVPSSGFAINSSVRFGLGWNGPYLKSDNTGDNFLLDGWGNSFVYSPTANPPTLISYGADGAAGGTGYNADITMQMPTNTLTSTVHGFITYGGALWSGIGQVVLNQPNGNGVITQQTTNVALSDNGHFSFSSVPLGVRSATVYVPNQTSPTQTIGPVVFTVDQPYYVIKANYFDLNPVQRGPTNLEVPIEMADYGLTSGFLTAITFERTRTPLITTDYDGTVTYAFEVVGTNVTLIPYNIAILNSSGATVGNATIPALTNTVTRVRSTFTPTVGSDNYRVQMPVTLLPNQVTVTEARMIVRQVGATKTKVYVPLIAANTTAMSTVDTSAVDSTNSTTFSQPTPLNYSVWKKEDYSLSLTSGTPYTLNVEISGGAAGGTAALYDRTTGLAVSGASVTTTSGTIGLQQVSFSDTAPNFPDEDEYELRIQSANAAQTATVAKAGLWIALSNLGNGEVFYRTARSYTGVTATINSQRALINTTYFTNPVIYKEMVSSSTTATATTDALFDALTSDVATTGSTVSGSTLTSSLAKSRQRSSPLTPTSGDRFIDQITTATGQTSNVSCGTVVVQFSY